MAVLLGLLLNWWLSACMLYDALDVLTALPKMRFGRGSPLSPGRNMKIVVSVLALITGMQGYLSHELPSRDLKGRYLRTRRRGQSNDDTHQRKRNGRTPLPRSPISLV